MSANAAAQDSTLLQSRGAYEGAFHKLATEVGRLRTLASRADPPASQVADARARVEAAQTEYNERRNLLAELVLARQVQGTRVGHSNGERELVKRLAHVLWESAGRSDGHAESDWYRAEQLFRMLQTRAG